MIRPADDSPETWHVHDDNEYPDWGYGIDCDICRIEPTVKKGYDGPMFNIERLKSQNVQGITTAELIKEIYDGAKETGIDITRAR